MTSLTRIVCRSDETGEETVCNDKCRHSELAKAVMQQDVLKVKTLLKNPESRATIDSPVHERPLVWMSCRFGNVALMELLLDAGVDINAQGGPDKCTPLHCVSCTGRLDMLRTIVARGAEVNRRDVKGKTPLWYAASNGHLNVIRFLVGMESIDVDRANYHGITPLIIAELNGFLKTVMALVASGADVNLADFTGNTPLMHAVRSGNSTVISCLLSAQADPNKPNQSGERPVHIAANHGNVSILHHLIQAGCNVNVPAGPGGDRPAMMAVRRRHNCALRELVTAGAEVDFQDATTPLLLIEAIITQYEQGLDLMRTLIQSGCDVNRHARAYEMTPIEYALLNGRRWPAIMLVHADADPPRKLDIDLSRDDPELYTKVMTLYRKPLSMKRLCRKSIRKNLGYGKDYEWRVSSLMLPTTIKHFLLYTDLNVEHFDLDR